MVLHDSTAGRCCLYRAMGWNELSISYVKCTVVQGWESNTIAIASRWPWIVTHGGARGRAISFYSMPRPSPCSGALITGCSLEVVALPAFIEEAAFQEVDSGVCRGLLACWPSCRMQQSIHYHIGLQQTSAYSGSTSCYKRCCATLPGIPLHLRQGLLLDHSRREGVSSKIIFE